ATLRERAYQFTSTDQLRSQGIDMSSSHPILLEHEGTPIISISCNYIVRDESDEFIANILANLGEFFGKWHVAVDYNLNDMLILDNWRMIHSRNAFTDLGRHLKRIQIAA